MDVISFSEAATANDRISKINANPDSNSGIVTQPMVIATGESVTVPNGRMAVLPNIQIDGELVIDGEVFVPSGATVGDLEGQIAAVDAKVDTKAPLNNAALTGVPTAPTASVGTDTTQIATTAFVKAKSEADSIGVNQTWQDLTASRVSGVTYTNSTGKPIMVVVTAVFGSGVYAMTQSVGGIASYEIFRGSMGESTTYLIVPNGNTYSVYSNWGSFSKWIELR